MFKRNKPGFTLLELVIVMVIIGVLTSFVLPMYQRLLESSYAAEAILNIGAIRNAVERCYLMSSNKSYEKCYLNPGENTLDIDNPNQVARSHWRYTVLPNPALMAGGGFWGYGIEANRTALDYRVPDTCLHLIMFTFNGIPHVECSMSSVDWQQDGKYRWAAYSGYQGAIPKGE